MKTQREIHLENIEKAYNDKKLEKKRNEEKIAQEKIEKKNDFYNTFIVNFEELLNECSKEFQDLKIPILNFKLIESHSSFLNYKTDVGRPSRHDDSTSCKYDKDESDPIEISVQDLHKTLAGKKYLKFIIKNKKLQELYDLIIFHDFTPKWFAIKDESSRKQISYDSFYETNAYGKETACHSESEHSYDCTLYLIADSSESFKSRKEAEKRSESGAMGLFIFFFLIIILMFIYYN